MKATLSEYGAGFSINLKAENMEEAAMITRFGLNSAKNCYYKAAFVGRKEDEEKFSMTVAISKKKRISTEIK
ncbi:MAG: hypothetical protein CVU71_03885 [Deltaproteobacteria bacterium HGW-Deltaproteobacteria-6]|jgi:hypothetical protein|nr:MAG: hypothetical protein CVU71_03885 [Deltaproteobacteria bacterium HGW-Deltaproteobacteria-6]